MVVIGGPRLTLSACRSRMGAVVASCRRFRPAAWAAESQVPAHPAIPAGQLTDEPSTSFENHYLWNIRTALGRLIGFAYALPFLYFVLRRAAAPAAAAARRILLLAFCRAPRRLHGPERPRRAGRGPPIPARPHLALALLIYATDAVGRARGASKPVLPHAGKVARPTGARRVRVPATLAARPHPALSPVGERGFPVAWRRRLRRSWGVALTTRGGFVRPPWPLIYNTFR